MSSRQFTFFALPSDMLLMEERIRRVASDIAFLSSSGLRPPQVLSNLRVEEMGKTRLIVYAARRDDLGKVMQEENTITKEWSIDVLRSPVFEITRCYFNEGEQLLRSGRFYLKSRYFGEDDALVIKPKEFLDWAKKVYGAAVATCTKTSLGYVAADALTWREATPAAVLDPY